MVEDGRALTRGAIYIRATGPRGAAQAAPQLRTGASTDGKRRPRPHWEVAPHLFMPPVLTTPQRCSFSTDAYQLMRNVAFAHEWANKHRLRWFRVLVGIVDAAPKASDLPASVAAFKDMLNPDFAIRVGIASYERLADLLDGHDEGDLASWVRARLAVASISTAAFAGVTGRPSKVR